MKITLTFSGEYGNTANLTEDAVLDMYRSSKENLIEKINRDENLALFIVDHGRLAGIFEGLPGNNYYLVHFAVRHPNIALHVLCNRPELHSIHANLGQNVRDIALMHLGDSEKRYTMRLLQKS
jgi:hypothetical protein